MVAIFTKKQLVEGRVKIISDMHFGHRNIVRYSNRPGNDVEDFDLHNHIMAERWRAAVADDDTVINLGDIALNPIVVKRAITNLPGNVFFYPGNHDKKKIIAACQEVGWKQIPALKITCAGGEAILTHYPLPNSEMKYLRRINLHGHVHTNTGSLGPRHINLCVEDPDVDYTPIDLHQVLLRGLRALKGNANLSDEQLFDNFRIERFFPASTGFRI